MGRLQLPADKILDAVVVLRRDGTVADWNGCAAATFGWSREEAIGQPMSEMIIPPEHREGHAEGMRRYLDTGETRVLGRRIEITALDKSGREFPVELSIAETELAGEQVFLGFLRDISERKRAEIALAESEARLDATYNHALVGIAEVDEHGRFLRANAEFSRITGFELEELKGLTLFEITHPDDQEEDRLSLTRLWRGELAADQRVKRYIRRDGSTVWIDLVASVVRGAEGARSYGVRVVRDITDRKRAEERQQLLLNELNHRVKNTLAVVQSIAQQTFRTKESSEEQIQAFERRLAALSVAHNILTRESWSFASLAEVVQNALSPFCSNERCSVEGPDIRLNPRTAVTMALAMHELATNASKYGALSNEKGRVHVRWNTTEERLQLIWEEAGGPRVQHPARRGFGSRMIERALAAEVDGSARLSWEPGGLRCEIDAALGALG